MGSASRVRRICVAAVVAAALALALAANAGAYDYSYQSYRGVKCTMHTDNNAWGTKNEHSVSGGARVTCNRGLNKIVLQTLLIKATPQGTITVVWDEDVCYGTSSCGTTYAPSANFVANHLAPGVYDHRTYMSPYLNGHKGVSDPLNSQSDWWIAADARNQCTPWDWGVWMACQVDEPVAAAP